MEKAHRGQRRRIVLLGRCNTGKSSVLNLLAGQSAAMVSPNPGTTADPVPVSFELLPFGPVIFYDTAGQDEQGPLGELRRAAALKVMQTADLALLVTDEDGLGQLEKELLSKAEAMRVPVLAVFNKSDLRPDWAEDFEFCQKNGLPYVAVTSLLPQASADLRAAVVAVMPVDEQKPWLLLDLVKPGGVVLCVTPIDASAPAGRLIAPQVEALRELVEFGRFSLLCQHDNLEAALLVLDQSPDLVVADSRVIIEVLAVLPPKAPVTTFSTLFARLKGGLGLAQQAAGAHSLNCLKPGAKVLMAEACRHRPSCEDMGRVKIPGLMKKHLGFDLDFEYCSGGDFPDNLAGIDLVVHCGACMLTPRQMALRLNQCRAEMVPVTNFGLIISMLQGVMDRVLAPLEEIA